MLGGALLAPPLYWLGRWLVDTDTIPQLAQFPFHRYFNRAVMLVTLALLWPFLRWIGIRRWTDLGLAPNPKRWRHLATGIVTGLVGLWLVALMVLLTDRAELRAQWPWLKILGAAGTATIVPIIEETFFQGALLGALRRHLTWQKALLFLALVFATVHFLKPHPQVRDMQAVTWLSGFALVPGAFWQFGEPQLLVGQWTTLFLVGLVLAYTVVRTRSLYMAAGLHAGWVFALRSFYFASRRLAEPDWWFGRELITGLAPIALVLATGLALRAYLNAQSQPAVAGAREGLVRE